MQESVLQVGFDSFTFILQPLSKMKESPLLEDVLLSCLIDIMVKDMGKLNILVL